MPKYVLLTIFAPRLSQRKKECQGPCLPHCYRRAARSSQKWRHRKTPKRSQSHSTRTKLSRRRNSKRLRNKHAAR